MLTIKRHFPITKLTLSMGAHVLGEYIHRMNHAVVRRTKALRGHIITRNHLIGSLVVAIGFFGTYALLVAAQQPVHHPIATTPSASQQQASVSGVKAASSATPAAAANSQVPSLQQATSAPAANYTQPASSAPVQSTTSAPAPAIQPVAAPVLSSSPVTTQSSSTMTSSPTASSSTTTVDDTTSAPVLTPVTERVQTPLDTTLNKTTTTLVSPVTNLLGN